MDAIEYLTDQHREVESLFDQFESALRMKPKLRLWRKLADLLVLHYRTADAWGDLKPDYVGEETDAWIVYPWEPPEETRIEGPDAAR